MSNYNKELIELLIPQIQRSFPDLKPSFVARWAIRYLAGVSDILESSLMQIRKVDLDNIPISGKAIQQACGRVLYNSKKHYLFTLLSQQTNTSLLIQVFRGNKGRFNRYRINEKFQGLLLNTSLPPDTLVPTQESTMPDPEPADTEIPIQDAMLPQITEFASEPNVLIPVTSMGLQSFIQKTQDTMARDHKNNAYTRTLTQAVIQARQLLKRIQVVAGQEYLAETWNTADSGRRYATGSANMQQITPQVREAALGVCHKYDFRSCALVVMLGLARQLDPALRLKLAALEDYICHRSRQRDLIARQMLHLRGEAVPTDPDQLKRSQNYQQMLKQIKSVLTAAQFGAQISASPRTQIRRIMGQQGLVHLQSCQEFLWIYQDLQTVFDTVAQGFPDDTFELTLGRHYHPEVIRDGKPFRRRTAHRLAWIYQNFESYFLKYTQDLAEQRHGVTALMTVHDCVYYAVPIPLETLKAVTTHAYLDLHMSHLTLEHTAVNPITTDAGFQARYQAAQAERQAHLDLIQDQEAVALGYQSIWCHQDRSIVSPPEQYQHPLHPDYESGDYESDPRLRRILGPTLH